MHNAFFSPVNKNNVHYFLNQEVQEIVRVRDAIKLIESDGWYHIITRGSHRQYKHPVKPGRITIAGKPSDDLAQGTLNSILKQAGLKNIGE